MDAAVSNQSPAPSHLSAARFPAGQTLMIDADDTLWENNIYFERAIAEFINFVDHRHLSPAEVRHAFNQTEHARVKIHGYGAASFRASMLASFEELTGAACTGDQASAISGFAQSILDHAIDVLPGVQETLPALAERHRLILVTKGSTREQTDKLDRSGLRQWFHHVEVLPEKHADAYHSLRDRHGCEAATTWMIGNSPKSDINPALAAGLHAIYLPHPSTWVLEHEVIATAPEGQHLIELKSFAELASLF